MWPLAGRWNSCGLTTWQLLRAADKARDGRSRGTALAWARTGGWLALSRFLWSGHQNSGSGVSLQEAGKPPSFA